MEREVFICDCKGLEHQVAFWYDKDDESLYLEPHLVTDRNFLQRLWFGIKYAFGYKSRFGAWDEIILNPENQKKLYDMLNDADKGFNPSNMNWVKVTYEKPSEIHLLRVGYFDEGKEYDSHFVTGFFCRARDRWEEVDGKWAEMEVGTKVTHLCKIEEPKD